MTENHFKFQHGKPIEVKIYNDKIKRFIPIGNEIWHDNEVWCIAGGKHCADVIATALNDFDRANRQLNESRDELIRENRHIKGTIQSMLINERTMIGKSVLKQLWDAIHIGDYK